MPWAEMAKKRTTLHSNAYNEIPTSNYKVDFRNGNTIAKREAIKPPPVTWSDRPEFQAESQYKVSKVSIENILWQQRYPI